MPPKNANQGQLSAGGFGSNTTPNTASAGTVQQGVFSRPVTTQGGFGSSNGGSAPRPSLFGHTLAPKPAENSISSEEKTVSLFGTIAPSNTPAVSTAPATQMVTSDLNHLEERYHCTSCKVSTKDPSFNFFCCDSCNKFFHNHCVGLFIPRKTEFFKYFGLGICKTCYSRLQSSTPLPFPIHRPLCHVPVDKANNSSDERPLPRRSSRDPTEIARSRTPDHIAIISEHFATEPAAPLINWFPANGHNETDESDEPMIEALFETNDLVILLTLPQEHPDHNKPFKVVARYFNHVEYPAENDNDEADVHSTEKATHTENGTTSNTDEDNINDLLEKSGWFYKLDRNPSCELAMLPNIVLWHEDDLGLALEDDTDDEEDLDLDDEVEAQIKEEVVTKDVTTEIVTKEEAVTKKFFLGEEAVLSSDDESFSHG